MLSEKQVQAKFLRALDKAEIYYVKIISCSKAGVPDCIVCYYGLFYAVEFKSSKGNPSKLQEYNFEKIEKSYGRVQIITEENIDFAIDLLTNKQNFK